MTQPDSVLLKFSHLCKVKTRLLLNRTKFLIRVETTTICVLSNKPKNFRSCKSIHCGSAGSIVVIVTA